MSTARREEEVERLKWEFLKRSPRYKELCELYRKNRGQESKVSRKQRERGKALLDSFSDEDFAKALSSPKRLPGDTLAVYDAEAGRDREVESSLFSLYYKYGDVHESESNFDAFWKSWSKMRKQNPLPQVTRMTANEFCRIAGAASLDNDMIFRIGARRYPRTKAEILKEISALIGPYLPDTRLNKTVLERYIQVYDWVHSYGGKKINWKSIREKYRQKYNKSKNMDEEHVRVETRSDYARARTIIQNIEGDEPLWWICENKKKT
jgi:hypothetical protein